MRMSKSQKKDHRNNQHDPTNNRILIALGDPAGIGIEVTLKAIGSGQFPPQMEPVLIGCKKTLIQIYLELKSKNISDLADPRDLKIEDLPIDEKVIPGNPNAKTGAASFLWLTHATKLLLNDKGRALVTAPIAKQFWHDAGHFYPGQTERLGEIAGGLIPSMLFTAISPHTGWRFNTLLATTHIPLAEVPNKLKPELVFSKLTTLLNFCTRFTSKPRLSIAGLNPHAGEAGNIGNEEIDWLLPTLHEWQSKNPKVELNGPMPPDTCWLSAMQAWQNKTNEQSPDGFLALYHDQGLIPTKLIAFNEAVNTTLGLPFIRTSPDHGTAFDIAGKGSADAASMLAAIKTSWELSEKNN